MNAFSYRQIQLLFSLTVLISCSGTEAMTDVASMSDNFGDEIKSVVDSWSEQRNLDALTKPPLLEQSIVDLSGDVLPLQGAFSDPAYQLGDVWCDEPCAFPFGAPLPEGIDNIGFEFIVRKDAVVRAATAGYVHFMRQNNNTQDYEVHVKTVEYGAYRLIYDHIQPNVQEGDVVEVGQVLGTAGPWGPTHGRVELQMNFEDPVTFETWAVCPATYGTDDFVSLHEKWLAMHNLAAKTSTHSHFQTYDSLCMAEKRFP